MKPRLPSRIWLAVAGLLLVLLLAWLALPVLSDGRAARAAPDVLTPGQKAALNASRLLLLSDDTSSVQYLPAVRR